MTNEKMENLKAMKKVNMLDEAQLEQAAGGTLGEVADDSRFLNVLLAGRPGQPDRHGKGGFLMMNEQEGAAARAEIRAAWKSVGISYTLNTSLLHGCTYKLNGKEITQEQARQHAMNVVGRQLKESDWDW